MNFETIHNFSKKLYYKKFKDSKKKYKNSKLVKNILITGASGNLGYYLSKILLKNKNTNIYILCRNKNEKINDLLKNKNIFFIKTKGIEYKNLGVNNKDYNFIIYNIDTIFHNSAIISNKCRLIKIYKTNTIGTLNIIKLMFSGIKKELHYSSTLSVNISYYNFSSSKKIKPKPLKYRKYKNYVPKNNYTITKIINEIILYQLRKKLNIKIYRLGLLFEKKLDKKSYVNLFMKDIYCIPENYNHYSFDYTTYDYAAKNIVLLSKEKNNIFNISTNTKISLLDIKNALKLTYCKKHINGWLKKLLNSKEHHIFEMTNVKGFDIQSKKINLNKKDIINEWK